jgi:hypothetical protein
LILAAKDLNHIGRAGRQVRIHPGRVILGVLAVLFAAGRPAAAAVADYLGKPIGSVRLLIEDRETTEPLLTQVVSTAAGQPLSMVQVRETVAHLFSLGRFEGVTVDATLEGGRVALRYELIPIHPVARIRFDGPLGVPGINQGDLRRALVDRYGVTPPLGSAADMTRILSDALHERGYLNATITPRPVLEHSPERATLVFTIDPGPRAGYQDVRRVAAVCSSASDQPWQQRREFADQRAIVNYLTANQCAAAGAKVRVASVVNRDCVSASSQS